MNKNKVWTTHSVDSYKDLIRTGKELPPHSPFWQNDPNIRAGDIVFEYTKEEKTEIKRCMDDILYFADKYAYSMTDTGVIKITLRDYQRNILKQFQENRFNVLLSSRQTGKCVSMTTRVRIRYRDGRELDCCVYDLYFDALRNSGAYSLLSKIKHFIYWIISRIESK